MSLNIKIDFERDPKLTKTLKGDEKWSNPKADIVGQIEDLVQNVMDVSSGASVDTLVFGRKVLEITLEKNESVKRTSRH